MNNPAHEPVLLHESIDGLQLESGMVIVDGTVGLGGHSKLIAEKIGNKGILITIDLDSDALGYAKKNLKDVPARVMFCKGSFKDIYDHVHDLNIRKVDGVLLDLGWNSTQLEAGRGFSFKSNDPLIMTYEQTPEGALTASKIVNSWSERDLGEILRTLGEERYAHRIAHALVLRRRLAPINTAHDLAEVIVSAVPVWYRNGRLHPATKTFQALRIVVNSELSAIEEGVRESFAVLKDGRRLAIITFHSLEDALVKRLFKEAERSKKGIVITKKPITPSKEEVMKNPRARSAKLRIFEKRT